MHWSLAVSLALAWYTSSEIGHRHSWFGYLAGVLVLARIAIGFGAHRYARFDDFLTGPHSTLRYAKQAVAGRAPRYLGHNPLGGWMVLALLTQVLLLLFSGWALDLDSLWGYAWPVRIHVGLAWIGVLMVALHLCGVLWTSRKQQENLVAAMFSGEKPPIRHDDVA